TVPQCDDCSNRGFLTCCNLSLTNCGVEVCLDHKHDHWKVCNLGCTRPRRGWGSYDESSEIDSAFEDEYSDEY
ncbi:hypothetical protein KIPB_002910, partial [Kipferlia bialata]